MRIVLSLLLTLSWSATGMGADAYPDRPVRATVAFGRNTNIPARLIPGYRFLRAPAVPFRLTYSAFAPVSLISSAFCANSRLINAANCSGVFG